MPKTLTLEFEGFFQCRLATDPDPPTERRGVSGYTFAVACESDFDNVIRLQRTEIADGDFRSPFPPQLVDKEPGRRFGVFVQRVLADGRETADHPLLGAAVSWPGAPVFEIRNQIVADGNNRLAPVIAPFAIEIRGRDGAHLSRSDPLDPENPKLAIWQLRPEQYQRRVPTNYFDPGSEVLQRLYGDALGAFANLDAFYNAYFQARQEWLELEITRLEAARAAGGAGSPECPYELQIEALKTRIYAIDEHTGTEQEAGRMENRLGIQTVWDFEIVGTDGRARGIPGGRVPIDLPWRTHFWMGGWDGDLLIGYLSGRLEVPFVPVRPRRRPRSGSDRRPRRRLPGPAPGAGGS